MNDPINIKRIIKFREPKDYRVEHPKVIIDGYEYTLYDHGSLSLATPDLLAKVIERLEKNG